MTFTRKALSRAAVLALPAMLPAMSYADFPPAVATGTTLDGQYLLPWESAPGVQHTTQHVYGTATNTVIGDGAVQIIDTGGKAQNTTVLSGGQQGIHGESDDLIINPGGVMNAYRGSTVNGLTVGRNAAAYVAGGNVNVLTTISNVTVENSGRFDIYGATSGITATDVALGKGALSMISGNARLNNWQIDGQVKDFDNGDDVSPLLDGAIINSSGDMRLYYGSRLTNAKINGGTVYLSGASTTFDYSEMNSGRLYLQNGAQASNIRISSGTAFLQTGAELSNAFLVGGTLLNQGGHDSNLSVVSGIYQLGDTDGTSLSTKITLGKGATAQTNNATIDSPTIGGDFYFSNLGYGGVLKGDVFVQESGRLVVNGSSNINSSDAHISLEGALYLHGLEKDTPFTFSDMQMRGGYVIFDRSPKAAPSPGFSTLTLDSLSGQGTFVMNTALASGLGNHVTVTGEASGDFDIQVADSGKEPLSAKALELINVGRGNATFILANRGGVVDLGTWQYQLIHPDQIHWLLSPTSQDNGGGDNSGGDDSGGNDNAGGGDSSGDNDHSGGGDGSGGNDNASGGDNAGGNDHSDGNDNSGGNDAPVPPAPLIVHPAISPSAAAVLSAAGVVPEVFRMYSDQIQARLDVIRQQPHGLTLWMQALDGQVRVDGNVAGADYSLNMGGVMLGLDRSLALGNGLLNSGVFFSPGGGNARFSGQGIGSSDIRTLAAGIYSVWQHRSGAFVDGQLTVSHVRNAIDASMTGGEKVQGRYNSLGVGMQLKVGVNRLAGSTLLTPYLGMRGLTGAGEDLSLSNGMTARIQDQRLLAGLAGIRVSQGVVIKQAVLQPYADLHLEQSWGKGPAVVINDQDRFHNSPGGSRGVMAAGLRAKLSPSLALHAQVAYGQGNHTVSPWQASLGGSWSF